MLTVFNQKDVFDEKKEKSKETRHKFYSRLEGNKPLVCQTKELPTLGTKGGSKHYVKSTTSSLQRGLARPTTLCLSSRKF